MKLFTHLFCACLALTFSCHVYADQTQFKKYSKARKLVWSELYPHGGWTLYCGVRFEDKTDLNVEHLYPVSWIAQHLGCGTRKNCQQTNERFNRIEADLHNLYPAGADINRARSNHRFAMIAGELQEFESCDFERDKNAKTAEPRPIARGNAARAIFT